MSPVTIYHNPQCGTSRTVLALMRERGIEPAVVEYLKTPLDKAQLKALIAKMDVPARNVLRQKEALAGELGFDDPALTDEALIDAMVAHPILMNRPIVVTRKGARLCRPPEKVLDLLPAQG